MDAVYEPARDKGRFFKVDLPGTNGVMDIVQAVDEVERMRLPESPRWAQEVPHHRWMPSSMLVRGADSGRLAPIHAEVM